MLVQSEILQFYEPDATYMSLLLFSHNKTSVWLQNKTPEEVVTVHRKNFVMRKEDRKEKKGSTRKERKRVVAKEREGIESKRFDNYGTIIV